MSPQHITNIKQLAKDIEHATFIGSLGTKKTSLVRPFLEYGSDKDLQNIATVCCPLD